MQVSSDDIITIITLLDEYCNIKRYIKDSAIELHKSSIAKIIIYKLKAKVKSTTHELKTRGLAKAQVD